MKNRCSNCGLEIKQSFKEWLFSKLKPDLCLCDTCDRIRTWQIESRGIPGASISEHIGVVTINKFRPGIYEVLSQKMLGNRCAIKLKSNKYFCCTVQSVEKGYLTCKVEKRDEEMLRIPVLDINCYEIIDPNCLKYNTDSEKTIKGFKGVNVANGILRSKNYIYELGIPYVQERKDPFGSDYQDTYSHFCLSMEDVLFYDFNYIKNPILYHQGFEIPDYRLFEVEAKDHSFENTSGGWVSNHLTLVREVTPEEIYSYLINHPFLEDCADSQKLLKQYRETNIRPYKNGLTRSEVESLQKELLERRPNKKGDYEEWLTFSCNFDIKRDCCYLFLRADIYSGRYLESCAEYKFLRDNNCQPELDALERVRLNRV